MRNLPARCKLESVIIGSSLQSFVNSLKIFSGGANLRFVNRGVEFKNVLKSKCSLPLVNSSLLR